MKFLKILLILIVFILGLFLIPGLLNPQVKYGAEIKVNKSVEEAWAVSQDESKYPLWLKGFKSMELLSGEKAKVGSTYKVIVNPGEGQEDFEMIETLKSIKENEHVKMHFVSDMMDFGQTIIFSNKNGETIIKSESHVIGKNIMMKSMFAFMEMLGGSFEKQEQENFDNLKKVINENTTNYFPEPVLDDMSAEQ